MFRLKRKHWHRPRFGVATLLEWQLVGLKPGRMMVTRTTLPPLCPYGPRYLHSVPIAPLSECSLPLRVKPASHAPLPSPRGYLTLSPAPAAGTPLRSEVSFKIKSICFWILWSCKYTFLMVKINNFRGDLSDISAKTLTLRPVLPFQAKYRIAHPE